MHHVRGNHDAMITEHDRARSTSPSSSTASRSRCSTPCGPAPSAAASRPTSSSGSTTLAGESTGPVLVFGHHHPWDPSSHERNEHYFGINPDDSEALCAVIARRESIAGYFAGSHAPQPRAALPAGAQRPDRRGRVREGLSGRVGRVPHPRRWLHAARPADRDAGRDGAGPRRRGTCSPACTATTRSARSPTAASPTRSRPHAGARRVCASSTWRRCSPVRARPATSPTSAPTSSRSKRPAATACAAWAGSRPRAATPTRGSCSGGASACIVLDLKTDAGRDALLDLADDADVLIENFRPGTLERLGLGPDVLHARNPRPRRAARHRLRPGRSVRVAARLRDDGRGDERIRRDQR